MGGGAATSCRPDRQRLSHARSEVGDSANAHRIQIKGRRGAVFLIKRAQPECNSPTGLIARPSLFHFRRRRRGRARLRPTIFHPLPQ